MSSSLATPSNARLKKCKQREMVEKEICRNMQKKVSRQASRRDFEADEPRIWE